MYAAIFKSGHALEQYPKIKFSVRESVRWLEHILCLAFKGYFEEYFGISKAPFI